MQETNFPGQEQKILKNIHKLIAGSDQEFAANYLADLSSEELFLFLEECPEFPSEILELTRKAK